MNMPEKFVPRCGLATLGPVCVVLLGVFAVPPPARAINIILNYESVKSVNPAQDLTASGLQGLFAYAESFYQDVFQDTAANTTITLNFWYENLDSISTGTFAQHALVNQTDSGGAEPWREIEANLRFDNDRTWFIDPTPASDSEFNMSQTLWRDLTGAQQSDFYNNFTATNIPETFEVGWRGTAVNGGAADGLADLLSTVMHEIGHSLGMSSSATGTSNEVSADFDYDFDSSFIFGETLAAEAVPTSRGHIDVDFAMMCRGCAATSLRRMPSHTDLFSMAAGNNYSNLDVPRREFYGGTDWDTAGNWSGNAVPDASDDVFVRDPGAIVTANLSAAGFAADLTVAEGGNIDTGSFKLDVAQTALVTGMNTDLFIPSGGELEATLLRIEDQGKVQPSAGGLIDVNALNVSATGSLIGNGTIDVATSLSNDGTISSSGGGTLTFTSTGGAVWDLDGGGSGVVNAVNGDIHLASGTLANDFDGTMTVAAGRIVTFANGWSLGTGGVLQLNGGDIVSPSFNQFGNLTVNTSASGLVAASTFEAGSSNTLNADLDLLGNSMIRAGATFSGTGSLKVAFGTTLTVLDGGNVGVEIVNEGSMALGSSPGVLNVADFSQTASGQISFELQGLTQGTAYDWMNVSNNTTLDGLMDVSLLGGFIPSLGDSFEIITAGAGLTGVFNMAVFPVIPNIGLGIMYTATSVTLNAGLLGDLNADGFVGVDDMNIVLANWNALVDAGVWLGGDPTGDGFVGIDDLNIVLANWNAGSLPPAEALALVPEPGMLGLLTVVSSSLTRRSRHR